MPGPTPALPDESGEHTPGSSATPVQGGKAPGTGETVAPAGGGGFDRSPAEETGIARSAASYPVNACGDGTAADEAADAAPEPDIRRKDEASPGKGEDKGTAGLGGPVPGSPGETGHAGPVHGAAAAGLVAPPVDDRGPVARADDQGNEEGDGGRETVVAKSGVAKPGGTEDRPAAQAPVTADGIDPDVAALIARRGLLAARRIGRGWEVSGRDEQKPPVGDWSTWLVMGGRGSGKTRAGAEWVHALALAAGPRTDLRIALVAETLGDAREVMIDGASGIARIARRLRPEVEITRRRIVWPNGAIAQIFSSEDPESLRGPQFHYAWCDELAKWKHAEETFDMLQFGLRLGERPRQLVTTTPRAVPLLKRLIGDAETVVSRLSTAANRANLAPGFIAALERRYGGTRLGRQELGGELIEDREDGLWRRDRLEALTIRLAEPLRRIVVAVDPPAGSGPASVCGIVVAGLGESGRAVVLADASVEGKSPADWARAVVATFRRFEADRVVAEVNQGGDMVAAMLRSVEANLPLTLVRATRGKYLRAEPVAALYEQGRVLHAARFAALEDQMCDFGPDGLSDGRSPDRLDALVWALTALMLEGAGEPRIRGI
ncbi:DNA-packaging protein [Rhizobium sp. S-51]|uniref:DNA-packaging protein n=1 Tax=Rhizobium terricola TaxID=2728849 RepID=A0A7Y0FW05_9HYPH|nr:DNA-packaging protein [Rhizobium terricola]